MSCRTTELLFLSKLDALREGQLPAVVDRAAERNKPFISNMGEHAILRILEWSTMCGESCTASTHRFRTLDHCRFPSPLLVITTGIGLSRQIPLATALTKCTTDLCPVGWDIHIDNAAVRSAWPSTPKLTELPTPSVSSERSLPDPLEHTGRIGREETGAQALRHVVVHCNGLVQALGDGQHVAAEISSTELCQVH